MRILLVEDDRLLGDGLKAGLTQAGYAVDWLRDGEAAVAALSDRKLRRGGARPGAAEARRPVGAAVAARAP